MPRNGISGSNGNSVFKLPMVEVTGLWSFVMAAPKEPIGTETGQCKRILRKGFFPSHSDRG